MKTRIEQVLEKQLNGREVMVFGDPTPRMLHELKGYNWLSNGKADPQKHYVIAVTEEDLSVFFANDANKAFGYPDDCVTFGDFGGELPFEWECHGVKIGRETYFGNGFVDACQNGYLESIGHFTSINGSAMIQCDHQSNMIFTSDDIQNLLTEENRELFERRYLADPKHPYALNKKRITIGSDVWIGAYSFINASKVTSIGHGAIIGAGAVVLEDVPPYAVVVGVPAKIKKYRFPPEIIEVLLRVKWWNWSAEEINANADALMSPEVFMTRFGQKGS